MQLSRGRESCGRKTLCGERTLVALVVGGVVLGLGHDE